MRCIAIIVAALGCFIASAAWAVVVEVPREPKGEPVLSDDQVRERLRTARVEGDFEAKPAQDAVDALAQVGKVSIVFLPREPKERDQIITLKIAGLTVDKALDKLVATLGLQHVVQDGVVFISDAETIKAHAKPWRVMIPELSTKRDETVQKRLQETIVSVSFDLTPALEAARELEVAGKVNIVVDRAKLRERVPLVRLKLDRVSLATAVRLFAEQLKLKYVICNGVVFMSDEEGVRYTEADAAREAAEKKAAADWEKTAPPADLAVLKQLREKRVTFTVVDKPCREAFDSVAKFGGVKIVLDVPENTGNKRVTLKLIDVPLETAIRLLGEQTGLKWSIKGGAVRVEKRGR